LSLETTPLPVGSALSFKTYFGIEDGWDYGYVQVSTDGGASWTNLASNLSTSTDPHSQNLGNGITGESRGWVDGHVDLSAYQGRSVKIRFSYVCDAYTYGDGWYIDLISVGPTGAPVFSDDVETLKPEWAVTSNRTTMWTR
jgi:immune inhibitor A